jgi:hypothetical protein
MTCGKGDDPIARLVLTIAFRRRDRSGQTHEF